MKKVLGIVLFVGLLLPYPASAAWYWLTNPEYPDLGDFVNLSALEYEEFESKVLLIPIENDSMEVIDEAEEHPGCEDIYQKLIGSLKDYSKNSYEYWESKLTTCLIEEKRKTRLADAFSECDMEYIDEELSSSEKVTHNKEIADCREKLNVTEPSSEIKTPTVLTPPQPSEIKQAAPAPVSVKSSDLEVETAPIIDDVIVNDEETSTSTVVETPPLVEQNQISEQNTVQHQTLLQRVFNFFVQFFTW